MTADGLRIGAVAERALSHQLTITQATRTPSAETASERPLALEADPRSVENRRWPAESYFCSATS